VDDKICYNTISLAALVARDAPAPGRYPQLLYLAHMSAANVMVKQWTLKYSREGKAMQGTGTEE